MSNSNWRVQFDPDGTVTFFDPAGEQRAKFSGLAKLAEHFAFLLEENDELCRQRDDAEDRAQSWKNLCTRFKELSEARGEALDLQRERRKTQ